MKLPVSLKKISLIPLEGMEKNGWLAIDPKGVVGPGEYECGSFLMNPAPKYAYSANRWKFAKVRIAIMSERLGYDRSVIRDWAFCYCVLSAWWSVNEREWAANIQYKLLLYLTS